ncbi:MAG: ABC transporter ATP-binding protein [Gammaproteobacteria bacterium]
MENLISVKGLHKRFGRLVAVNGIDLEVRRGEVLGFLGPNGAGKSTTMKMITGFLAPTAGAISVCGHDVLNEPIQAKEKIGYLPEGAPAYGEMTPSSFLDFIADIRGLSGKQKRERIDYAIDQINLQGVVNQPIETLSKGFKRRVGLAQAILHDPEVLILDEPTDGLDPNQKHEVRSLIENLAHEKAIVISTHILEEVDAVCSNAVIIAKGKVLFSGTPSQLAASSAYHNAVNVSVSNEVAPLAAEALENLAEVAAVETSTIDSESKMLTVIALDRASIVDKVRECLSANSWPNSQLFIEAGRLDEVFRTITIASHGEDERS